MLQLRWFLIFALLVASGCGASEADDQSEVFVYNSVMSPTSVLTIYRLGSEYNVALGDLALEADIKDGASPKDQTYLIADGLSLAFFIPSDLSDDTKLWTNGECSYEVIEQEGHTSSEGEFTTNLAIEQVCPNYEFIVRYIYSRGAGLRSISIGSLVEVGNNERHFMARNAFYLGSDKKGFGAE